MKIGLIKEGKTPADSRVALTPVQCSFIQAHFPVKILIEPCKYRCFSDEDYMAQGVELTTDLTACDLLLGIKEVPINQLMPHKIYFFFSHTIKKQAYNKALLQAIIQKDITLIDYEVLTDEQGTRLIAFGKFAGIVGAHNALLAYAQRTGLFELPRLKDVKDYATAKNIYKNIKLPPMKIAVTGGGRVASGILEMLQDIDCQRVTNDDYLNKSFDRAVYVRLHPVDYVERKDGEAFDKRDYYRQPSNYKACFERFYKKTDILANGIFYDPRAPRFFELEDMQRPDFNIKIIADVTCDLMPHSSIPSTLRSTTIAEPFYGFDPQTGAEISDHFAENAVTMMTIDNLPNELPRDASIFFGEQFIKHILPEILRGGESTILTRATIVKNGQLTPTFQYLQDYVA